MFFLLLQFNVKVAYIRNLLDIFVAVLITLNYEAWGYTTFKYWISLCLNSTSVCHLQFPVPMSAQNAENSLTIGL